MKVKMASSLNQAESIIWTAARTCKSDESPLDLWSDSVGESDKKIKLIKALWRAKHYSIFEHASVTFLIEGISRTCLAQLTRHRHLSFSVQSQRYVNMENATVTVPPAIFDDVVKLEVFGEAMSKMKEAYSELMSMGIKQEDARFVLPEASCTNLVLTCNLRSLGELYEKRVKTKGAQWEIIELVDKITDLACAQLPWYKECLDMM